MIVEAFGTICRTERSICESDQHESHLKELTDETVCTTEEEDLKRSAKPTFQVDRLTEAIPAFDTGRLTGMSAPN